MPPLDKRSDNTSTAAVVPTNGIPKATPRMSAIGPINRIRCAGQVVPLDDLEMDPDNARLHPEKNMAAIRQSLALYGQMVPLVVRAENMRIAAGNGRYRAMREFGWTQCAVSIQPMTDAEFTGFALADNRTAELAQWDFETVARLDKLMVEFGESEMIGWSADELEVLRAANWTPPTIDDSSFEKTNEVPECPNCGYRWE